MVSIGASPSRPSPWRKPAASSKSWPGVRMVVATSTSSRWISRGSSTTSSSGARPPSSPSKRRVSTVTVRPRGTRPRYRPGVPADSGGDPAELRGEVVGDRLADRGHAQRVGEDVAVDPEGPLDHRDLLGGGGAVHRGAPQLDATAVDRALLDL